MHSLIRNVGQGSNRHDFVGEGAKVSLIFLILFEKKDANWSANDFSDSWDEVSHQEPYSGFYAAPTIVFKSHDYCTVMNIVY